jgi:hypothetical protein
MFTRTVKAHLFKFLIGVSIILCASCAHKTSAVTLTPPKEPKIRLSVGYYLDPSRFSCDYIYVRYGLDSLKVGKTLCDGFDTLLRTAFSNVIRLSSLDTDQLSEKISTVIVPEIDGMGVGIEPQPHHAHEYATISITWKVMDIDKNVLWTETITGEGYKENYVFRWPSTTMNLAIHDLFQKALESIQSQERYKTLK